MKRDEIKRGAIKARKYSITIEDMTNYVEENEEKSQELKL